MLPTVIASAAAAGEPTVKALGPSFPAATTTIRPASTARFTMRELKSRPLEEPSLPRPTGECARLEAPNSQLGYQILSYAQQKQCPHNQNLVAILGKKQRHRDRHGPG